MVRKPSMFLNPIGVLLVLCLLAACGPVPVAATPTSDRSGFSEAEYATLNSLEQLDDYPLYVMHYGGAYLSQMSLPVRARIADQTNPSVSTACQPAWGCSLFAALGDAGDRLYGRNFDWRFSPALLLYTAPPDGYASVSMVDMEYLGFTGELSKDLTTLSLDQRRALLEAPSLPFDGMNEKGLAIGMAAVPAGQMTPEPQKKTIDQLQVMREILDHAASVGEALQILEEYNIDMGTVPIHYLIASASGDSALVEFHQGQMFVFRNQQPWQQATNFLVASTSGSMDGVCWRYDRINQRLKETGGKISTQEALRLLEDVSQDGTQWSVVYDLSSGEINIVMGREYVKKIHTLQLDQSDR